MREYIAAFDIAKKRDYFAGMIFRRTPELVRDDDGKSRSLEMLDLVHIEKHGNLAYQDMAEVVATIMGHRDLKNNADLLVDGTGVGEAAVELIRAKGLEPTPIIFTGGAQAREILEPAGRIFGEGFSPLRISKGWTVPKADMVAAGQIIMQQRRLRVAPGLRWADDFKKQLEGFKGKVNEATARRSYNAESDDLHDDLVVCYLMAAWWSHRHREDRSEKLYPARGEATVLPDWDPVNL